MKVIGIYRPLLHGGAKWEVYNDEQRGDGGLFVTFPTWLEVQTWAANQGHTLRYLDTLAAEKAIAEGK